MYKYLFGEYLGFKVGYQTLFVRFVRGLVVFNIFWGENRYFNISHIPLMAKRLDLCRSYFLLMTTTRGE